MHMYMYLWCVFVCAVIRIYMYTDLRQSAVQRSKAVQPVDDHQEGASRQPPHTGGGGGGGVMALSHTRLRDSGRSCNHSRITSLTLLKWCVLYSSTVCITMCMCDSSYMYVYVTLSLFFSPTVPFFLPPSLPPLPPSSPGWIMVKLQQMSRLADDLTKGEVRFMENYLLSTRWRKLVCLSSRTSRG